ncbi:hypothetical protein DFR58_107126 [Anaerobacterium chartisolvens]|uniref:Uncharacterized protein n=1 Tax=Anaerobacterium chartisolvens TaxID=1297424 RepID=A0A369B7T0_9FIRM|nr:hypothetical protein DFR58_107126 [Anaerobacterium chartisolvens]
MTALQEAEHHGVRNTTGGVPYVVGFAVQEGKRDLDLWMIMCL